MKGLVGFVPEFSEIRLLLKEEFKSPELLRASHTLD